MPSHYLNQCGVIVDWTIRNKLPRNFNQNRIFFIRKIHLKMSSAKWRPFCPGGDDLIETYIQSKLTQLTSKHKRTGTQTDENEVNSNRKKLKSQNRHLHSNNIVLEQLIIAITWYWVPFQVALERNCIPPQLYWFPAWCHLPVDVDRT